MTTRLKAQDNFDVYIDELEEKLQSQNFETDLNEKLLKRSNGKLRLTPNFTTLVSVDEESIPVLFETVCKLTCETNQFLIPPS